MAPRLLMLAVTLFCLAPTIARADDPDGSAPPQAPDRAVPPAGGAAPVELKIPSLSVDAPVFPVGMDDDGAMDVPPDADAVAWWSLGPGAGVPGNMVLSGHVDWGGRLRVFGWLRQLGPGDQVVVVDEQAREFSYTVVESRWVPADAAPVQEIFDGSGVGSGVSEVTLITCGGDFDHDTHQYLDRLIVRATQA